jgi:hypothetical protein
VPGADVDVAPPLPSTPPAHAVVLESIPLTLRVPAGADQQRMIAALEAALPAGAELATKAN